LWIVGLVAALAAVLANDARTAVHTGQATVALARARAAAEAGIWLTVRNLVDADASTRWPTDGSSQERAFADFNLEINIWDEGAKVDLNFAGPDLLRAVFVAAGVEEVLAAALPRSIIEWREPLPNRAGRSGSQETRNYPGRTYGPAYGPFVTIEDLLLLPGMTSAIFDRVRRDFTVYSQSTTIDPNGASLALLSAISGAGPATVPFSANRSLTGVGDATRQRLGTVGRFSGSGTADAYSVRVRAAGLGVVFIREAVILLTPDRANPYQVVRWQQREDSHSSVVER
jgi:general secretion pathway protein K